MRSCRRDDSVAFGCAARPNKSHGAKTMSSNSWAWNATSGVTAATIYAAMKPATKRRLKAAELRHRCGWHQLPKLSRRRLISGLAATSLCRSILSTSSASLSHACAASSNAFFLKGSLVRVARCCHPSISVCSRFHWGGAYLAYVPHWEGESLMFVRTCACCDRQS
jgi:hypothetical protein